MSEYKGQHTVIIDGYELTPIQSNHVVQAIENQLGEALDDMMSIDVDPYEKQSMVPAVKSLAEVLNLVAPEILFDGIDVVGGKAIFEDDLEEFNTGVVEEALDTEEEAE
jgi:hypothetical protein